MTTIYNDKSAFIEHLHVDLDYKYDEALKMADLYFSDPEIEKDYIAII